MNGVDVLVSIETKEPPKDTAALESSKVLANVSSQGSGT